MKDTEEIIKKFKGEIKNLERLFYQEVQKSESLYVIIEDLKLKVCNPVNLDIEDLTYQEIKYSVETGIPITGLYDKPGYRSILKSIVNAGDSVLIQSEDSTAFAQAMSVLHRTTELRFTMRKVSDFHHRIWKTK